MSRRAVTVSITFGAAQITEARPFRESRKHTLRWALASFRALIRNSKSLPDVFPQLSLCPEHPGNLECDQTFTLQHPSFDCYKFRIEHPNPESRFFHLLLDGALSLNSHRATIHKYLSAPTGESDPSTLVFFCDSHAFEEPATSAPLRGLPLPGHELRYLVHTCSVYHFMTTLESVERHDYLILKSSLTIIEAMKIYKEATNCSLRKLKLETIKCGQRQVVQISKRETLLAVSDTQELIITGDSPHERSIVFRKPNGSSLIRVPVGRSRVADVCGDPALQIARADDQPYRIAFRVGARYLDPNSDLFNVSPQECVFVISVPLFALQLPKFVKLDASQQEFLPTYRIDPIRDGPLDHLLDTLRVTFGIAFDCVLVYQDRKVTDLASLVDVPDRERHVLSLRERKRRRRSAHGDVQSQSAPEPKPEPPRVKSLVRQFSHSQEVAPHRMPLVPQPQPVTVTFALYRHPDVALQFPATATVVDARRALAERYDIAAQDVVLLHQGRALNDRLLLARLRLAPGAKLFLHLKDASDVILRTAVALRMPLLLTSSWRLHDVREPGRTLAIEVLAEGTVFDAKLAIDSLLQIGNPERVALVWQNRVLDGAATLKDLDIGEGELGFTVNPAVIARFNQLRDEEGEASSVLSEFDDRKAEVLNELQKIVNDEELAEVMAEKGEMEMAEAIALYVQAGNKIEALREHGNEP